MSTTVMQATATLNLMGNTKNVEQFKRVLDAGTVIDAKVNFLTCEGETISVDVFEILNLEWKVADE